MAQLHELIQLHMSPLPTSPLSPSGGLKLPPLPVSPAKKHAYCHHSLPPPSSPSAAKVLLVHRKLHTQQSSSPSRRALSSSSSSSSIAASPGRRQPLIRKEAPERGARCLEVAGGTVAGCAAVCCCFPCGLVDLLVLAVVRLPAGLCRRAIRQRRKRKKAKLLRSRVGSFDSDDDFGMPRTGPIVAESWPAKSPAMEVSEKEREMWAQFYNAGFWRSPSQRE